MDAGAGRIRRQAGRDEVVDFRMLQAALASALLRAHLKYESMG